MLRALGLAALGIPNNALQISSYWSGQFEIWDFEFGIA
jgi:hypothetical protein